MYKLISRAASVYRSVLPSPVRKHLRPGVVKGLSALESAGLIPPKVKPGAILKSATSRFKDWQLHEALYELSPLLTPPNQHMEAVQLSGDILARMGRVPEAQRASMFVLRRDRLNLRAIKRLIATGRPHQYKLSAVEWEVKRSPMNPRVYLMAAQYLNEGLHLEEALFHAKRGLDFISAEPIPGKREALQNSLVFEIARALEEQGRYEDAIAHYQALSGAPIGRKSASPYARCLLETDRVDEAERVLNVVGAYPGGPIPFNAMLHAVYYKQKRIGDAHLMYRDRPTSSAISEYFSMPQPPRGISLKSGKHQNESALFISEGGPGDELRFASTYSELQKCVGSAMITCDPRLKSIFSRSFPQITFLPVIRHRKEFLAGGIKGREKLKDRLTLPLGANPV